MTQNCDICGFELKMSLPSSEPDKAERASSRRWCGGPAQWHMMPPEVMFWIFRQLPDQDRCHARLVCKNWKKVFHMPQLWRQRSFKFFCLDEEEGWRASRYLETLGSHLRHMEVCIGMPVVQNARMISLAVEQFLTTKSRGMRLKTFSCSGLELFQSPLYRIARHRVRMVRALCCFLRRQRWLEHINLACSQMGKEDGARVLRALTVPYRARHTPSSPSLSSLELGDFFLDDVNVIEFPAFHKEVSKLAGLRHVGLNVTYLSDAVLLDLTRTARALESLALSMDGSQLILVAHLASNKLTATTEGWRAASHHCPRLRVLVDMRGRFRLSDFQRVLLPGMPLGALSITSLIASLFFGSDDMLAHLSNLLDYLNDLYSQTLNAFHLGWFDVTDTWTDRETLVRLVRTCGCLRYLSLGMTVPLDTVVRVATAAASSKDPLHVYVASFERSVDTEVLQAKLASNRSRCVVHTGKQACRH